MPSRDLNLVHPALLPKVVLLMEQYMNLFPARELVVIQSYRTQAEQIDLYAQGRTRPGPVVTHDDGIIRKSPHQFTEVNGQPAAKAVDFGCVIGGRYLSNPAYYHPIGDLANAADLRWGGTWGDWDHVELA